MTNVNVIEGNMFVIPNSPAKISDLLAEHQEMLDEFQKLAEEAWKAKNASEKEAPNAEKLALQAIVSYKLSEYSLEKADSVRKEMKKFFGGDVKDDEELIQVWVYGSGSENWSCHGWPGQLHKEKRWSDLSDAEFEERQSDKFPTMIPAQYLKGVKEGETVKFAMEDGRKFALTANQLQNRYRRFGRFEEVLEKLLNSK